MGELAFQPFDWPDPQDMITKLKDQGFHVMVIEEPYITKKSRNYPEALAKGYFAKHFDGSAYTFDFWPGELRSWISLIRTRVRGGRRNISP